MKKILVLHTKYREFGGEDNAVEQEIKFLESNPNYKVEKLLYSNNSANFLSMLKILITGSNNLANKEILGKIKIFNPDIIYIHNTWFFLNTRIFKLLKQNNHKVAIKLHNFRYVCTESFFARDHFKNIKFCKACGNNRRDMGVFNKYYLDSYFKSFFVILYGRKYIKVLKEYDFKIIVLNNFHKDYLTKHYSIKQNNVFVIPNFIDNKNQELQNTKNQIVYAGRVSKQKGLIELLDNFLKSNLNDYKILIIGDGPDLKYLKNIYISKRVEFRGAQSNKLVIEELLTSKCVVTSTKMLEGQPTLLCEASLNGVPSIFPDNGGIKEFFPKDYQLIYNPDDDLGLLNTLNKIPEFSDLKEIGLKNKKFILSHLNKQKIFTEFEKLIYS